MRALKRFNSLNYQFGMKLRLYPNTSQKNVIRINSFAMRWYYNRQLGLTKWESEIIRRFRMLYGCYWINNPLRTQWLHNINHKKRRTSYNKKMFPFLKNKLIDCMTPGRAYIHTKKANDNYKNHLQKHARFHSRIKAGLRENYQTSTYSYKRKSGRVWSAKVLDKKHIYIKSLGKIRTSPVTPRVLKVFEHNNLRLGTITINRNNLMDYYVSMQLGSDEPFIKLNQRYCKLAMLGYDLNVSNYLMDNYGDKIANPKFYQKLESKLKFIQHCLSRKGKHNKHKELSSCSNYQLNRIKLAKIHKQIYNKRHNFLERLSTKLAKRSGFLAGESLESSNLLKNHEIAKAIQTVGWHAFINMLIYKAKAYHTFYILVDPAYTTQRCSKCGYVMQGCFKLGLKDRIWQCPNCGAFHIRDVNASINILYKAILTVQQLLPKRLQLGIQYTPIEKKTPHHYTTDEMHQLRLVATVHKTDLVKYLLSHYRCGVLDSAKPNIASLNTIQPIQNSAQYVPHFSRE